MSAISSSYSEMADQIDLRRGPVWALSCVHAESKTYLIFAINHFACDFMSIAQLIREIVQLYEGLRTVETLPRDTYIDYLNSIAQASSTSDLSAGARWWLDRPWDNELRMRGVDETRVGHHDLEHRSFEQLLTTGDIRLAEETERQLLLAVAHSIFEVSESPVVRLAVCHHGRNGATRRHAVGWMSQVLPLFLDRRDGSGTLDEQINEVERREPDWCDALEHMRMLTPPPMIGGVHAFVNYVGELPTRQRRIGKFLYEPMWPGGVAPVRQRSYTPLCITVQRLGDYLSAKWEYNDMLRDPTLPRHIASRVSTLLRDGPAVKGQILPPSPAQAF
jgi:hypothetical protein